MLIILIMFGIVLATTIIGTICDKKGYDGATVGCFISSIIAMTLLIVELIFIHV